MKNNIKIVVLQRGWVFVGEFSKEESQCTLTNASCIRKWGTTNGLGQIALKGPTSDTVLDETGTVQFHELTTICVLDCNQEKWQNKLV